jgi:predicted RND superfamily exporter protein
MDQDVGIVSGIDDEVVELTGGTPKEYDLDLLFKESQDLQKRLYGGGEENTLERQWIEGLLQRQREINERKSKILDDIEEVEEVGGPEIETKGPSPSEHKIEETVIDEQDVIVVTGKFLIDDDDEEEPGAEELQDETHGAAERRLCNR